jgi:hypothetical protein
MRKGVTFILTLVFLFLQAPVAGALFHNKTTSIEKAKPLIRSLYYGQSQASQRGLSAELTYIANNLYPGMYSNPQKCLNDLVTRYGSLYGQALPRLSTVDYDKSWVLPTGLKENKLSGKTPKGDIFVLEVKWSFSDAPNVNHVVIFKGKPYYFLWVCEKPEFTTEEKLASATGLKWKWWPDSYFQMYDFVYSSGTKYRWMTTGPQCHAVEFGSQEVAEAVAQRYLWDYAGTGGAVMFVPKLNLVVMDSTSGAICSKNIMTKFGGRYTLKP